MTNEVYNEIVQVSKAKKYLFTNAAIQTCFSTYGTISSDSNLLDLNTCIVSINSPALTLSDYRYLSDVFIFANIGSIQNVLLDGSTRQTTAQILGLSTTLTTSTKTSLIAAINEVSTTANNAFHTAGTGLASSGTTVSAKLTITSNKGGLEFDVGDSGLAIKLDTNSGLNLIGGDLAVGAGSGIAVSSGTVSAKLTATTNKGGLEFDSGDLGLAIKLATTSGLGLTGGSLAIGAGTGITVNSNNVALASTTAGAGLTHTTGVLNVIAGDSSLTVAADSIAVNLKTTNSGLEINSGLGIKLTATTNKGGLEFDSTDQGLGVKVDGSTITINPSGALVSAAASPPVAGNGISVSGYTVSLSTTTAGNGLTYSSGILNIGAGTGITVTADSIAVDTTGLSSYLSSSTSVVKAINSLFTQKLSFLLQVCSDDAGNMITFLQKLVSPTTTDTTLDNMMQCSQLVARISKGISSGTKTVFCSTPSFPTACSDKASCASAFNTAITSSGIGTSTKTYKILHNTDLLGVLIPEVCSQYDI